MHLSAQKILDSCVSILANSTVNFECYTMMDPRARGFVVVECQNAPNENNKRVCVPKTWVTYRVRDNRVAIVYPPEESLVAGFIKNKEPANVNWQLYIGKIKHEAETYSDAINAFLKLQEEDTKQIAEEKGRETYSDAIDGFLKMQEDKQQIAVEKGQTVPVADVAEPKTSLKLRIVVPKPIPKSEKKEKSSKRRLKEHSKHKESKSKHKRAHKKSLKHSIPDYITERKSSLDSMVSQVALDKGMAPAVALNYPSSVESAPKSLDSGIADIMHEPVPESRLNRLNLNSNNYSTSMRSLSESIDVFLERKIDISNAILPPQDKQIWMELQNDQMETLEFIRGTLQHLKNLHLRAQQNRKTLDAILSKYSYK